MSCSKKSCSHSLFFHAEMDFLISCREISFHFAVIFQCDTVNLLRQRVPNGVVHGVAVWRLRGATRLSWWNQAQHAQDVSVWDYWCGMGPILLKNVTEININRGGSRIFERGGAISGADTGFPEGGGWRHSQAPPPLGPPPQQIDMYIMYIRIVYPKLAEAAGNTRGVPNAPPPWTLSAWRHPPSEKLKNTPTLGHSQAPPPPWTLFAWCHPHSKGGGDRSPGSATAS